MKHSLNKGTAKESILANFSEQQNLEDTLNNKQDKLVSGTNIKTINGESILGSGNIETQDKLVSGTNIKTINGNSLLGSGDITIEGGSEELYIIEISGTQVNSGYTISDEQLSQIQNNFANVRVHFTYNGDLYVLEPITTKSAPTYAQTAIDRNRMASCMTGSYISGLGFYIGYVEYEIPEGGSGGVSSVFEDVDTLPDSPDEQKIYRVAVSQYSYCVYYDGSFLNLTELLAQNGGTVNIIQVSELPENPETFMDQETMTVTMYVMGEDLHGYITIADISAWLSNDDLLASMGGELGTSYGGMITSLDTTNLTDGYAYIYSTTSHSYINVNGDSQFEFARSDKLSEIENNLGVGREGTGDSSEVFNDYTDNVASGESSHAEGSSTTASGQHSHAEGSSTTASGYSSHAEGGSTTASGQHSHAEGQGTTASGDKAHAEGITTTASGDTSHAEGYNTTAYGAHSHAEGSYTTAYGADSHAEGSGSIANIIPTFTRTATKYQYTCTRTFKNGTVLTDKNGTYATITAVSGTESSYTCTFDKDFTTTAGETVNLYQVIGIASGEASHAEGYCTTASGQYSHTEGDRTTASGQHSHAEGGVTTASGQRSHAEGSSTTASGHSSHAEGGVTTASGQHSHAEGWVTTASGDRAHAEGSTTTASGIGSHAEGYGEISSSTYTFTRTAIKYQYTCTNTFKMGEVLTDKNGTYITITAVSGTASPYTYTFNYVDFTTTEGKTVDLYQVSGVASGSYSHAEGDNTTSSSHASHAEGKDTIASGYAAHAEGSSTRASGNNTHAEGANTVASGNRSHAEGFHAVASGENSHAEGYHTRASGESSHAEGDITTASGDYSHAEGYYTIAASQYQHVQGKYNIEDSSDKYAHIVGSGSSNTERSNAHTLDWNGNAWFKGNVRVGGTSWDDATELGSGGGGLTKNTITITLTPSTYPLPTSGTKFTITDTTILNNIQALLDNRNNIITKAFKFEIDAIEANIIAVGDFSISGETAGGIFYSQITLTYATPQSVNDALTEAKLQVINITFNDGVCEIEFNSELYELIGHAYNASGSVLVQIDYCLL